MAPVPAAPTITGDITALTLRVRSLELRLNPGAVPGWQPVVLDAAWTTHAGFAPPEYRKTGGLVEFRGAVEYVTGTIPTAAVNLTAATPDFQLMSTAITDINAVHLPCLASTGVGPPFTVTAWLNPRYIDGRIRVYASATGATVLKLDGVTYNTYAA